MGSPGPHQRGRRGLLSSADGAEGAADGAATAAADAGAGAGLRLTRSTVLSRATRKRLGRAAANTWQGPSTVAAMGQRSASSASVAGRPTARRNAVCARSAAPTPPAARPRPRVSARGGRLGHRAWPAPSSQVTPRYPTWGEP
jgi:hypothetical protein